MSKFLSGWYLIYTKPCHEKKVYARLLQRKIDSFLPTRKMLKTWHDRKKYIDEPLFPSYVFIYLKDLQSYYEGMDTDGALYYVKAGTEMARVSDVVVDSIRLATDKLNEVEVSGNYFQQGRRLIISQGAFTGLVGELIEYENRKKILIRVEMLQRNVLISLPEEYLLPEECLL
nr:UpxY family transcription antiterminator [uncultured Chitinophaga sp.]